MTEKQLAQQNVSNKQGQNNKENDIVKQQQHARAICGALRRRNHESSVILLRYII